jgi:cyanate lyase
MSLNLPAYCTALLSLKATSELTFAQIAEQIQKPEVWTTALFFGQARTDVKTAEAILKVVKGDGMISYLDEYTGQEKVFSPSMIIKGLSSGLAGNGGMVQRGATWEWPPKVYQCRTIYYPY